MDLDQHSPPTRLGDASPSRADRRNLVDRSDTFEKLNRGDLGYGGNAFYGVGRPTEGLLAIKLRELDVQPVDDERETRS
jgi:hypothetical protein